MKDIWGRIPELEVSWTDESLAATCGNCGTCASAEFRAVVSFDEMLNDGGPSDAMRARFYDYIQARFPAGPPDVFVCTHPVTLCRLFMPWANVSTIVAYQAVFVEFLANPVQPFLRDYLHLASSPARHVLLANNRYHQAEAKWVTGHEPIFMPSLCRYTRVSFVPRKAPPYILQLSRGSAVDAATLRVEHAAFAAAHGCAHAVEYRDFASFTSFADAFSTISAVLYFPYTVS